MKKKKIAVFGLGWSSEIFYKYAEGLRDGLKSICADMYVFLSYPSRNDSVDFITGERNIFELPNLEDFDAVAIFGNSMDFDNIFEDICDKCKKVGIPTICTGREQNFFHSVFSDNKVGSLELIEHLYEKHGVRNVLFIAGSKDNYDSKERLETVCEYMKSKGCEIPEENIIYSDWDFYNAAMGLENFLKSGHKIPDAVVVANDTLAMVACDVLSRNNLDVPKDILLTGFDNEQLAKVFYPSISSVNMQFDEIGRLTGESLIRLMNNEDVPMRQVVPSRFVPLESCGCEETEEVVELRHYQCKKSFMEESLQLSIDNKLFSIEHELQNATTYEELNECFERVFIDTFSFEGQSFFILLDPRCREIAYNPDRNFRIKGYSVKMDPIFVRNNGEVLHLDAFDRRKIIPVNTDEDPNRVFILLPLHENEREFGYMIFCEDLTKLNTLGYTRKYVERMNIILSKFFQNLVKQNLYERVMELSQTDGLTHVKNRNAYEFREKTINSKLGKRTKYNFALAVFDINDLKKVNDTMGHDEGDKYIVNCCMLICKTFKHSAVYRIGGDEFVVYLENEDYENREDLMIEMDIQMNALAGKDIAMNEKVSVAGGLAVYDEDTDAVLADVFKKADKLMYERKIFMKNRSAQ